MDYQWPTPPVLHAIGTCRTRVECPATSSGQATYTYDAPPQALRAGTTLRSPYALARLVSVDTSAAESMPGVKAVAVLQKPGATVIRWAGDEIVGVAAVDEGAAADALKA